MEAGTHLMGIVFRNGSDNRNLPTGSVYARNLEYCTEEVLYRVHFDDGGTGSSEYKVRYCNAIVTGCEGDCTGECACC